MNFKEKHIIIKDREVALIESIKMLNKDSILLVLGKGREAYQLINQTKIPHNDVEMRARIQLSDKDNGFLDMDWKDYDKLPIMKGGV